MAKSSKRDVEIVQLALKNPEYFADLMERYEAKLTRYIRRISSLSVECTEDVLQEVFIKIYRNLNGFDPDFKFSSWAYRITHNETLNYLRKHRNKQTLSLETNDPDTANLIDFLESDTDLPEEFNKNELKTKVQKILELLPPHYREVIVLRYLEDMSYNEISDILKKPTGTVSVLLNRAKSQFKEIALKNNLDG